jgi:hypothetical protein
VDKMRAPGHFYFSPIVCELRAELLRYRDESTTCGSGSRVAARTVVRLETGEQTAHGIADLVTESFAAEEVAVDLWNAGDARWRVSIHFRAAPDQDALRALVSAAAGAEAPKALVFERSAARDWVRESLRGLKPVAAGRFVVHGAHDRARVPASAVGIEVEAALAFGTGHHGTTRGCLLALDQILRAHRARAAFSMSAPAPACSRSRPPRRCDTTCSRATSTRALLRSRPRMHASTTWRP